MKLGQTSLLLSVAWCTTPVSSDFVSLRGDPARATRPRNWPTALQVRDEQAQSNFRRVTPHKISSDGLENEHSDAALDVVSAGIDPEADEESQTAASLTGVKANGHADSWTTAITLSINLCIVLVCTLAFSVLRLRFPLIYAGNGHFPALLPTEKHLGWLSASLSLSTEMIADTMGLDAALMVEFLNMSCKILAVIGIPMVCIMCPLHYFYGGNGAGLEDLSSITMGNVKVNHRWLYYLHAVIVNLVTVLVIQVVYAAMPNFLKLRYKWLKEMPAPRCVTVLVEGIPEGWRSDAKLREYFMTMFKPEHISHCSVVKNAQRLRELFGEQTRHAELLMDYKYQWQAMNYHPQERPLMRERMCVGDRIDAIESVEKKLMELKPQVDEARNTALKEAEEEGGINGSTGFVTFSRRREAEVCHNIRSFSSKRDEWVVSVPPPASDVSWANLTVPETRKKAMSWVGCGCTWMLFFMFIPIVVIGTNVTHAIRLDILEPIWSRFAPGLALMLFLAFLPTVLLLIFSSFFMLKSETFAQHKLQVWYFLFMAFFVILVTVVGKSLIQTFTHLLVQPGDALQMLAVQMPSATHFYMDFLMLQWGEAALNFLRYVPLAKFLFFSTLYDEDDAKRMAEPEDQDFYGIGSRSARFTISLLIGIIFSTLSPLIAILALFLFGLMRIYYGYLVVFAETKKPDLGGVFYNTQLQHLIMGLGIYNVLMTGVLCFRAEHEGPMLIALPSLIYTVWSYYHFSQNFVWEDLPFSEVCYLPRKQTDLLAEAESPHTGLRYVQPEFNQSEQEAWTAKLLSDVAGPIISKLRSNPGTPSG